MKNTILLKLKKKKNHWFKKEKEIKSYDLIIKEKGKKEQEQHWAHWHSGERADLAFYH